MLLQLLMHLAKQWGGSKGMFWSRRRCRCSSIVNMPRLLLVEQSQVTAGFEEQFEGTNVKVIVVVDGFFNNGQRHEWIY